MAILAAQPKQAVVEQTRVPHLGHQLRIVAAATALRPWP
jgi:hypothetical protein